MKRLTGAVFLALILMTAAYYVSKIKSRKEKPSLEEVKEEAESSQPQKKRESIPAIDFDFQDLNGRKYYLSDFKGKVIILNFRRRECPACEYELAFLKNLYNRISGDENIMLVPLFLGEGSFVIADYLKGKNIKFSCYVDDYGLSAYKYRVYAVPTTFIIDKHFQIVNRVVGVAEWDSEEVISWLEKLSNE